MFVLSLCIVFPLLTRSHVVMGRFDVDMKEGDTAIQARTQRGTRVQSLSKLFQT